MRHCSFKKLLSGAGIGGPEAACDGWMRGDTSPVPTAVRLSYRYSALRISVPAGNHLKRGAALDDRKGLPTFKSQTTKPRARLFGFSRETEQAVAQGNDQNEMPSSQAGSSEGDRPRSL